MEAEDLMSREMLPVVSWDDCDDYYQETLQLWYEKGLQPGGFVTAVLANDLFGAIGRADLHGAKNLIRLVSFIYNELPSSCYGTEDKVSQWSAQQLERR